VVVSEVFHNMMIRTPLEEDYPRILQTDLGTVVDCIRIDCTLAGYSLANCILGLGHTLRYSVGAAEGEEEVQVEDSLST